MNLTDMIKQPAEGNRPKTDFMNMRKFESGDRLSESVGSAGAENTRGIDNLIQGLVDLLPKRDGIWPLQERAKWLRLAAGIFDLGYKAGDGEHSEITIMVVTRSCQPPTNCGSGGGNLKAVVRNPNGAEWKTLRAIAACRVLRSCGARLSV